MATVNLPETAKKLIEKPAGQLNFGQREAMDAMQTLPIPPAIDAVT